MIVGFVRPDSGHVYLDNEEITRLAMFRRARRGIGYLPQESSIFRKLSVENNIRAVLEMTTLNKVEQDEKTESLISEFGLEKVRKNLGDSLSGGERRRTEIARALATNPSFILLDEPFAGIDPIAVEDIQQIVAKLRTKNIGILITDHNVQETLSITDRSYLMVEGTILRTGTSEELAEDELVRKLYLGVNFELKKKNPDI
jgi:lipopolysaccharide export system ATP-binding protein